VVRPKRKNRREIEVLKNSIKRKRRIKEFGGYLSIKRKR